MRRYIMICAILGAFSTLGLASTWSGTLLDANCYHRHENVRACGAKPHTTRYLLDVKGTKYRLDSATNDRAQLAMQSRAEKANNPDATKATPVYAKLTGYMNKKGKIRANIIEVR